jgi:hypothetical protein
MLTRDAGYGPGMTDDPGVMGNLPRSRPGRRSSKRGGATGDSAAKPATEVTASSAPAKPKTANASKTTKATGGKSAAGRSTVKKPAAKPAAGKRTRTAGSTTTSARGRASAAQRKPSPPQGDQGPPRQEQATHGSTDPVTGAVLLAGKVVEGGLKVAGGIIKRLPRP